MTEAVALDESQGFFLLGCGTIGSMNQSARQPIRVWGFPVLSIATLLVYGVFIAFYGDDPHTHSRTMRELFIWPAIGILLGLYIAGYRSLKKNPGTPVLMIIAFATFTALMAVMITPFHSTDIYGYVNRGWQQFAYGVNPYTTVVDAIPGWQNDPMFTDHWVNNPCPYGFLFALLAKWLCIPASGSLALTVMVFKSFNLFIHGLIGWLVWLCARELKLSRPENALYLYLLNPLILLHQISNGHNDIVMALFITVAAYFVIRRWWVPVIPALIAGALVKYAALILIPFAAIYIIREYKWRAALEGCMAGGVVFLLLGAPFIGDYTLMPFQQISANATITHSSLHSVFFSLYKEVTNLIPDLHATRDTVRSALKYIILALFAAYYGFQLWWSARNPLSQQTFVQQSILVLFALICVASLKFYPWYLGMFFPLALLLPSGNLLRRFILMLTGFQLFAFTLVGQAHIANYLLLVGLPVAISYWAQRDKGTPVTASNPA